MTRWLAARAHFKENLVGGKILLPSQFWHQTFGINKMEDAVASKDAEVDLLVAIAGVTVEEATKALEECDGDVDQAIAFLETGGKKQLSEDGIGGGKKKAKPKRQPLQNIQSSRRKEEDVEDDSIMKPGAPKLTPAAKDLQAIGKK